MVSLVAVFAICVFGLLIAYLALKNSLARPLMGEETVKRRFQRIIIDPRFDGSPAYAEHKKELGAGKVQLRLRSIMNPRKIANLDYLPGTLLLDTLTQGAGTNAPVRLKYVGGQNENDTRGPEEARRVAAEIERANIDKYRELRRTISEVNSVLAAGKQAKPGEK